MEPVNAQIYSFLGTIVTGLVLGVLFDFYRVFRMVARPKKFFTCVGDLVFGVLATVAVFFVLLYSNWGEFRLYVFIGMIMGMFFYYNLLSKLIINLLIGVCRLIKRTGRGMKKFCRKLTIKRKKE